VDESRDVVKVVGRLMNLIAGEGVVGYLVTPMAEE
jgi:hypothetical protein